MVRKEGEGEVGRKDRKGMKGVWEGRKGRDERKSGDAIRDRYSRGIMEGERGRDGGGVERGKGKAGRKSREGVKDGIESWKGEGKG